ncbi:unnamed protein product [Cyprideis torosa]|uniref:Uncharacterized protein n=1 Tax=Cyprideis torosa TaxID=163714 RepID=A0A7R8WCY2_9CRUS|nr:unnamed protein product [Cyprideis torosa]CAG0893944.1 unnamed protein product [Cyprideis torosa]
MVTMLNVLNSPNVSRIGANDLDTIQALGNARRSLLKGDLLRARQYVSAYLSQNPSSAEAHRVSAEIAESQKDLQFALQEYRESFHLKSNRDVLKKEKKLSSPPM